MSCVPLSALCVGRENRRIRVRVSRLCYHRGGLEDGEIKEIRIVLVDVEGRSMYAVIKASLVVDNIGVLQEAGVYEINSFKVTAREIFMNPVDNPLVIMFTRSTAIQIVLHPDDTFPEWTYKLTPFTELPAPGHGVREFVDVIGVIRGVSDIATLDMPGRNVVASRRNLLLADDSGGEIKITLWGEAAFRFNAPVIRFLAEDESAVAVFVGMNVHVFGDCKELAGFSACRWYINVDIQEINVLRVQMQSSFHPIVHLPVPVQINLLAPINGHVLTRPLSHILNTDFYQNQDALFRCTVKVCRLLPEQRWWSLSCTRCGQTTVPVADFTALQSIRYMCSDVNCDNTDAFLEYRLYLHCSDGTGQAQFVLLGSRADAIVGISALNLVRNYSGNAIAPANLAAAAGKIVGTPHELAALASWTYQFVIRVDPNSFQGSWASFNVAAIEASYAPK